MCSDSPITRLKRVFFTVYLFEFKIDQDAQTALAQINTKNYAGRFKMDNRKVIKIGVSFSSAEKNIVDWVAEEDK